MAKAKKLTFHPKGQDLSPLPAEIRPSDVRVVTCMWEWVKVRSRGATRTRWAFRDAVPLDNDGRIILRADAERLLDDGWSGGDYSWWVYGMDDYDDDQNEAYVVPDGDVRAVTMWSMTNGVTLRYLTPPKMGKSFRSEDAVMSAFWEKFTPDSWQLAESTAFVVRYLFGWETADRWKEFAK